LRIHISDLEVGEYSFKVAAYDIDKNISNFSNIVRISIEKAKIDLSTATVVLNATNISENSVSFNWNLSDYMDWVRSYNIYLDGTLIDSTQNNYFTLYNLNPGTNYVIRISAIGQDNEEFKYPGFLKFKTNGNYVATVDNGTQEESISLSIYPNPSDGYFRLSYRYYVNDPDNSWLRIINNYGQIVYFKRLYLSEQSFSDQLEIILKYSENKSGIHFLTLTIGNKSVTLKIMIY
jgi:hypothetical protein